MPKTDPRRLACTACKHENEIERVYCHSCGEKLDRSLLPALQEPSEEERLKDRKKVKSMMNPNRLNWVRTVKTFVLIEILAAAVAAAYLAVQSPDSVPVPDKNRIVEPQVNDLWRGMMANRPAVTVTFSEYDLNDYLRKAVKGGGGTLGIKFVRAFTHLEPGLVTVTTERNVWGLHIFNSAAFKPVLKDGNWDAGITRYAIGRLTIPVGFAKLVTLDSVTLGPLSQVFEKEIKGLARVEKIEPRDGAKPGEGAITFVTKPQQ